MIRSFKICPFQKNISSYYGLVITTSDWITCWSAWCTHVHFWKAATLDAEMTGKVVCNTAKQCQDGQPGLWLYWIEVMEDVNLSIQFQVKIQTSQTMRNDRFILFYIEREAKQPKSRCMGQAHKVCRPIWFLLVVQDVEPQTLVVRGSHHSRQITQTSKELYPLHFLQQDCRKQQVRQLTVEFHNNCCDRTTNSKSGIPHLFPHF